MWKCVKVFDGGIILKIEGTVINFHVSHELEFQRSYLEDMPWCIVNHTLNLKHEFWCYSEKIVYVLFHGDLPHVSVTLDTINFENAFAAAEQWNTDCKLALIRPE